MKIVFVRKEDYWIFPLSFVGVLLTSVFLYAGDTGVKLFSGLIGLSLLYFAANLIKKNYSRSYSNKYIVICLLSVVITAGTLYLLTN